MDEILAAIAKIDAYLPSTATREIVSTQELQDILLDVRQALRAAEEFYSDPLRRTGVSVPPVPEPVP
jgi:hypothetical protein